MKNYVIKSLIVMLAWTYIVPGQAMLHPSFQQKRARQTSQFEPELTGSEEKAVFEVGTKSPEPVRSNKPIPEQPDVMLKGWQTMQQGATAATQQAARFASSVATKAKTGAALVLQQLSRMVNEVKSWSYFRICMTLLGMATALNVSIQVKGLDVSQIMFLLRNYPEYRGNIGLGAGIAIFSPIVGFGYEKFTERQARGTIAGHMLYTPLHQQREGISGILSGAYNDPHMLPMQRRMFYPEQSKIQSLAEEDLVERMKRSMVEYAQKFAPNKQLEAVNNFYKQENLESNDELVHRAYHEALDELGITEEV